jgi:glucose-1-phosphate thymidylyltransferase
MAGMGKRMRPHTLTIPKPLIPVAGKPIVHHLAETITSTVKEPIEEIAFIIGDFGKEVEQSLLDIAASLGVPGTIHYQHEAQGTAHAVLCAASALKGPVVVAFADTLFRADFTIDTKKDGIIWVHKVDNPSSFGVVKADANNIITDFIEKPKEFVSDLAIIGIYFFRDGENLKKELDYLIDNKITGNNEYQLTDALKNMQLKGIQFSTAVVDEWLDCGNKNATVSANGRMLDFLPAEKQISASAITTGSVIVPPCFIGENAVIEQSVIGPHVSIGSNTRIYRSVISNSIIQNDSLLSHVVLDNSMVGSFAVYTKDEDVISLGDYSVCE